MYQYTADQTRLLKQRVDEFSDQVHRFEQGNLSADIFQQLRLRNGLYNERYSPMLRVAIPYGTLDGAQMRMLAVVSRKYDKGYGHFTTRQNIQYNWPTIHDTPNILSDLAEVNMHAIQTSGSCIRNITSDHLAGAAADEIEDPRPWCELIRQWSLIHPEFNWLPRKFKFAVSGAIEDRAVIQLHDIGLRLYHDNYKQSIFDVIVGGGMGRTPVIGKLIKSKLPGQQLLPYLQSIIRIYNLYGRRDHKYKSRIKILVNDLGIEQFRNLVDDDFSKADITTFKQSIEDIPNLRAMFKPDYRELLPRKINDIAIKSIHYDQWLNQNTIDHKNSNFRIVVIPLKAPSAAPGDASAEQMETIANIAEQFGMDEIRVSHEQNIVLPWISKKYLYSVWVKLKEFGLATPSFGTIGDMICCPGIDYCSLANAETIPVSQQLNRELEQFNELHTLGKIKLKISGCMNACGHHHIGDIGILGVDKKGEQWYQITLGGNGGNKAKLGQRLGPAIHRKDIVNALKTILSTFLSQKKDNENFNQTVTRVGTIPFKSHVYATH